VAEDPYADQLSYGPERVARTWPRGWVVGAAMAATLAALLAWQLRGSDREPRATPSAAAQSTSVAPSRPTSPPTPRAATKFEAPAMRGRVRGELFLGGTPLVVNLPSGRVTAISGLPDEHLLAGGVALRGVTLLLAGDFTRSAGPGRVYAVADGTTVARALSVRGELIAAGATDRTFWVVPDLRGSVARMRAEERDRRGRLLRRVILPRGWHLVRGVVGGLLVGRSDAKDGPVSLAVWDPQRDRFVLSLTRRGRHPVATSARQVAWPDHTCPSASEGCVLHVTDLRGGADVAFPLAHGYTASSGDFSPDGTELALAAQGDGQEGLTFVVGIDTGTVLPIPGSAIEAGISGSLWTPSGDAVILGAFGDEGASFAAWRRDGTGLEVVPGSINNLSPVMLFRPSR